MEFKKTLSVSLLLILAMLISSKSLVSQNAFFTKNKGQVLDQSGKFNTEVQYLLSLKEYNVSFYKDHFAYEVFHSNDTDSSKVNVERIEVWFEGANSAVEIIPIGEEKEVINVFKNGKSFEAIKSFSSIYYKNILNGVDIEFLIFKDKLKYNYVVRNKIIKTIDLKVKGAKVLKKNSSILLKSKSNYIKEEIPESYYLLEGNVRQPENITVNTARNRIQYVLPNNRKAKLIIDPIAYGNQYTSYYGGSQMDFARSINISNNNQIILTGYTLSINNIATSGAYQTTLSVRDAYIAAFDNDGVRLWSTYFGGEDQERIYSAVIDSNNNIFIAGNTTSIFGLATSGSSQQYIASGDDSFLAKFSPTGILDWCTYYGGNAHELITSMSIDDSNKIYITGHTGSSDLYCTPDAYRSTLVGTENAFLGVYDNDGSLIYNSYYIKGSNTRGEDIEITSDGTIYIAGYTNDTEVIMNNAVHQTQNGGYIDGFVLKLYPNFQVNWKTYLGGDHNDLIQGMRINEQENIYLIGKTKSSIGIASANALQQVYETNWDGFVIKLDSTSSRIWGSYIQAGNNEELTSLDLKDSTIWLLGITDANSLLIDSSALQYNNHGGFDSFVMNLSDTGGLVWSTYFGGANNEYAYDIVVDSSKIFIAGQTTTNQNFSTVNAHQLSYGGGAFDGFWSVFCKPVHSTLLSHVGPQTICEGDTIAIASVNSFNEYLWSNGDTESSIDVSQTGSYILTTKDMNSCPGRSDTIRVEVLPVENLTIVTSSNAICKDDSVMLSVASTYSSYEWSNGSTESFIYVKDTTSYSLTATNSLGCEYTSDTIKLTKAQYIFPIDVVGNTTICSGGEAIIYSNSLNTISWNTLENTNSITVNSSGSYWFTGTDINNCLAVSDTITITQISTPSPSLVLDTISLFTICSGDTVTLIAEDNFSVYEWSNGIVNKENRITTAGKYFVEATDVNGCVGISDSVEVVVNPLPSVEITQLLDTLCLGDSTLVSTTNSLQHYNWASGETGSSYSSLLDSVGVFQIILEGIDFNNCNNYDTITYEVIDCDLFNSINTSISSEDVTITNAFNELIVESNSSINSIELIDYQGKVVLLKSNLNSKFARLELTDVKSSIYILKIVFLESNIPISSKVIVSKK